MSEKVNKVERSELWDKIHAIVKQIPRAETDGDAMDAPSAATEIERLFNIMGNKAKRFDELENIVDGFYEDISDEDISDEDSDLCDIGLAVAEFFGYL